MNIDPKDIEKQFRVRINDLITDMQTNTRVSIGEQGKLLYGNRNIFYKGFRIKYYRPLTFDLVGLDFKVSSLAIEFLDYEPNKGGIIQVKKSVYEDDLDYARVMRRTIQGLDDIGLLFQSFNPKNNY